MDQGDRELLDHFIHTNILHSEECESVRFVWTWERQAEVEK